MNCEITTLILYLFWSAVITVVAGIALLVGKRCQFGLLTRFGPGEYSSYHSGDLTATM
jgi:hypothetical protein